MMKNHKHQLNKKIYPYLKKNWLDFVYDVIIIFIFDILTSLFLARILITQMIKIIAKELMKNKIGDKIKEKLKKN